jgi:hypothetical protein
MLPVNQLTSPRGILSRRVEITVGNRTLNAFIEDENAFGLYRRHKLLGDLPDAEQTI